jgi:PPM family protein phosphatase
VPRLLEADPEKNCASSPPIAAAAWNIWMRSGRKELFAELEKFGVRHDDPDMRNVTYRQSDGRFCLIDFEFATILPGQKTPPA